MLLRYRITKDCRTQHYVILDRFKLPSSIIDKRLTKKFFSSREKAAGFIFGKTGNIKYFQETL